MRQWDARLDAGQPEREAQEDSFDAQLRSLERNLDAMAAGMNAMLLPALKDAAGRMGGLFEADGIYAAADGAQGRSGGLISGPEEALYEAYPARLHAGEPALTAFGAQRWRGEKGGGGVTPAQLTAAMAPVVEAVKNIRIALDIDGRRFADNQAANARSAQNRYSAQIAKGYGK